MGCLFSSCSRNRDEDVTLDSFDIETIMELHYLDELKILEMLKKDKNSTT